MRLLIMGPPGAGKGTQAERIKDELNIIHISTGSLLRKEIKNETQIGSIAKRFIDKGRLVPDSILLSIIKSRTSESDCKNGYILDGFPRTLSQARGLEDFLIKSNLNLNYAIHLEAKENELINRLIKRGVDSGRSDDKLDIIKKRQKIYWEETAPLLEYYHNKDILINIDGLGSIDIVTKRIFKILRKKC
tara:strand:- start:958 stop:1527 length:570 start_codon:yes stop_codon:yes gene_type:complete